ncbi:MAG: hypothetical protein AAF491_04280 [Verrucomicrobiota bacterium]
MSTAKSLTDDQIATIRNWADQGEELSDIQKKLADEMEVRITYLETRFLLEDLKIELKPIEEPKPEPEEGIAEEAIPEPEESHTEEPSPADEEEVSVTIDQVLRPGALISGQAMFAGGKSMAWWLDQMGQLGVDPSDPDFRPSEAQLRTFQIKLQQTIQQSGM